MEAFVDLEDFKKDINVANGDVIQAQGIGTVVIKMLDENNRESTRVQKVLYVPGVKSNILSVRKLCEKGYGVSFRGGICEINAENQQIAVGDAYSNLYKLRRKSRVSLGNCGKPGKKKKRVGRGKKNGIVKSGFHRAGDIDCIFGNNYSDSKTIKSGIAPKADVNKVNLVCNTKKSSCVKVGYNPVKAQKLFENKPWTYNCTKVNDTKHCILKNDVKFDVFKAGLDKCRYYQNYAVKIDTIQNQESQ